jgi:hypothetical protein
MESITENGKHKTEIYTIESYSDSIVYTYSYYIYSENLGSGNVFNNLSEYCRHKG